VKGSDTELASGGASSGALGWVLSGLVCPFGDIDLATAEVLLTSLESENATHE
jgi:hypothetical protein